MEDILFQAKQSPDLRKRLQIFMQQHARPLHLAKGEYIYSCSGDNSVYFIENGQLKLSMATEGGRICLLSILVNGELFGDLDSSPIERAIMATAMKTTALRRMPRPLFLNGLLEDGIITNYARYLSARLSEQQGVITSMVTANSEQRLAVTLVKLARKLDESRGPDLLIVDRISCEDLSAMVGTTRSRVGYFLKKFCKLGLVAKRPGCFLIVRVQALIEYVRENI